MKKIMFNDKYGLTKAVLEGRKTQTRRIVTDRLFQECRSNGLIDAEGFNDEWKTKSLELLVKNSPYKIGEEVAVAQAYKDIPSISDTNFVDIDWVRAIKNKPFGKWGCANKLPGWANKMFVRADLMPYRIKITNIRVERLQDISEEDCLKEGVQKIKWGHFNDFYYMSKATPHRYNLAKYAFSSLIDKTCGKGTWESNPWVFVYDFERIK